MSKFVGVNQKQHQIIETLLREKSYERAFHALMKEYNRPLYAMIFKLTKNHTDTDDVLQNTLIKVWNNLDKFKFNSSVFTWCYTIARNESLNWIKKNEVKYATDEVIEKQSWVSHIGTEEIWDILTKAVNKLPEQQKIVFELKYFQNMTYDEIAHKSNTSVGGLKANYHHAVKKIKEEIKKAM
jgi:RNA polymerase sigma-70 factor (ECF subfamily)